MHHPRRRADVQRCPGLRLQHAVRPGAAHTEPASRRSSLAASQPLADDTLTDTGIPAAAAAIAAARPTAAEDVEDAAALAAAAVAVHPTSAVGTATAADAADADAAPTTLAVANRCRRHCRRRRRHRRRRHRPWRRSRRLALCPMPCTPRTLCRRCRCRCRCHTAAGDDATAAGDDAAAAGAAEQTEDAERPLPVLPLVPRRMDAGAPCKPRAWARARAGQLAGVGSYPLVRYRVQYRCVAYSVMPM